MKQLKFLTCLSLVLLLLSSCANYKLNYALEAKDWEKAAPSQDSVVQHSIYLIGDTGNAYEGQNVFEYLKKELKNAPKESTIVFLGDNIYPVGMPPKSAREWRKTAEEKLDAQIEPLKDFKGRILFVPGNHDWMKYGLAGVKRQEKYIEKKVAKMHKLGEDEAEEVFLPNEGCNDPEVIEINDKLVIVAIDSQWWLEDWDNHREMNSDCEIRNRESFLYYFEETLRKYRTRNVVVVMHHPIFSNGSHGGFLTAKDHLFPLTQYFKKGYIPIPLIGSIGYFARKKGVIKQDLGHPLYKDLRLGLLAAATKNGNYIFAAGHEHNLQYWEKDEQTFIVSGSGSKENPVRVGNGGLFGYAKKGYARLDFYEDGSAWVNFYTPDIEGEEATLVFRRKIKDKLEILEEAEKVDIDPFDLRKEVENVPPITSEVKKAKGIKRPVAGKHYRDIYSRAYDFPTLNLEEYKGGVEPVKMGGGRQTNSLRLEDKEGIQYAMRALTKDATRLLPYPFNEITFAQYVAQDIFLSTHPFGALVIPSLADAANVYHTNPEYYYIPKQPALKEYNAFFGDEVYLVEDRPDDDRSNVASFGNSEDIISTPDMIEKLGSNIRHKVAQDWVVRARLFDLVIGDWDRHDDQWRWATFDVGKKGDVEVYRPIPRDRDQVFPNYDGLLVGIARFSQPILRQLDKYSPNIKSLKWSVYNTRHFDRSFMNELEWEDWEKEVKFIQENLSDQVIDSAFIAVANDFSVSMKTMKFDEIKEVMKKRRDNLMDFARRFYLLNAKKVDIVGTNDEELFMIDRLSDSLTRVRIYDTDLDTAAYERHFITGETREIHLYGLEDDDQFVVTGLVKEGIKIRIIGGLGEDEVVDRSRVDGINRKTWYYDFLDEENKLQSDFGELKDMRSESLEKNAYDRKHPHYEFNFTRPLPLLGYNPDEGLSLGVNVLGKIYEFKKSPLGQLHNASLRYISALNTIDFKYKGEFLSTIKAWDLIFNARAHGDRFAFNYFGLGNETENPVDDFDFNRTRQSKLRAELGLRKRFLYDAGAFSIRTFIEETELQNTVDRFIATQDFTGDLFEERYYTGILTSLDFTSVDNVIAPRRGANFHLSYDYQINLTDNQQSFGQFQTHLSMYFPIGGNLKYVLATRIGTAINSGQTDFFKRPFLGGNTNLRGFRAERFRGDATFYHNTDIRLKLFESINRVLPLTMGFHAGFDHGRVWLEEENSNKWHYSYGGGIWLAPVNFVILSAGVYRSEEQNRVLVSVGHLF